MMRRFAVAIAFLLALAAPAFTATQTHQTVPAGDVSFLTDLQNFLRVEDANRFTDQFTPFVASGGTHGTGAGLTGTPAALVAYPGGYYTTESAGITYQNNATCWVVATPTTTWALSGSFARAAGTKYATDCVSASQPAAPANSVYLMQVVTAGGAITAVTDLRTLSPVQGGQMLLPSSAFADLPAAGTAGRLMRVTDNIRGIWMDTGLVWRSVTGYADVADFGSIGTSDDTVTVQAAVDAVPSGGIVDGLGRTYIVTNIELKSNMRLENFNFTTKAGSTDAVTPVRITGKSNVRIKNVHVNGNRQNQTSIGVTEDGGRHGFRVYGNVDNIVIEDSSATYNATDGIMFGGDSQTNIKLINSKFNWNRRHGASRSAFDKHLIYGSEFNDNGQDLNAFDALNHGNRGTRSGGLLYGSGFTVETYGGVVTIKNFTFEFSEALRNVRSGLLFYDPAAQTIPGYIAHDNFKVLSSTIDQGTLHPNHTAIEFAAADPSLGTIWTNVYLANNNLLGYVTVKAGNIVELVGGSIVTTEAYLGVFDYTTNVILGSFVNPDAKAFYQASSTVRQVALPLPFIADKRLFGNAGATAAEWSSGIKLGTFTRDTSVASGTQAITGVGFKPSHVIFLANVDGTPEVSIGFDNGTVAYDIENEHNVAADTWGRSIAFSIQLYQTSLIYYQGVITALGADGFTITWTKTGAKTGTASIHYLAFR